MESKQERALHTFNNRYNCAQSVLSVFAADLGLSTDTALKLANNFGAGIVYMQQTCGAVTGALMAIGLKYGKGENGTDDNKEMANDMAQYFMAEFKKRHGSLNCLNLLENTNLTTPEGVQYARENNLFETHCNRFVTDAVSIAEKIIK
jgi:C_GCAxxG_C_C family probable redox protein